MADEFVTKARRFFADINRTDLAYFLTAASDEQLATLFSSLTDAQLEVLEATLGPKAMVALVETIQAARLPRPRT